MQKRFGALESSMLMARATFLDPRLKNNGFVTRSGYANVKESVTAAISTVVSSTCRCTADGDA